MTAPAGVGLMFATNGAAFASLLPWYPTLKDQWQLSDALFGLLVACFAAGSLLSTALPAWAERRFGPRATVLAGTLVLATAAAAVGLAPGPWTFALILLVFGVFDAVVDVSQNVIGVRVQDALEKSILSSLHACWSLGAVAGGAAATWAATSGIGITAHLTIAAAVVAAAIVLAGWLVGPLPRPAPAVSRDDGIAVPRVPLTRILRLSLPVALVAGAGTVVEDVANNWAGLAAVSFAGTPLAQAGVALTVTLGAQMIGRFTGDPLINRFGRVAVARAGGLLIAAGGVLVIVAQGPAPLYAGLAAAGFGCATLVPSAYAAAAALPGLRPSDGVTAVSWLMRVGFLTASPVIGLIAGGSDLRVALGTLVVIGLVVVLCAPALRARAPELVGTKE